MKPERNGFLLSCNDETATEAPSKYGSFKTTLTPQEVKDVNILHAGNSIPHSGGENKSIGFIGGIAIAVNSLAGPAILQLPYQYQQSGIIPTTLCLLAVAITSVYCSLHMANTISLIPGNENFDKSIEFSDSFHIFWGYRAYIITQVLFFFCTICVNVAAIVDTAEVVDSFLGRYGGGSYAWDPCQEGGSIFNFQNWSHPGLCTRQEVEWGECQPFADSDIYGDYVFTLGYFITAAVFLPICLMDLKENAGWQIFGFGTLVTLSVYFCWDFVFQQQESPEGNTSDQFGLNLNNVSLWGEQWSDMFGVILFNFALVLAIPAWLHEKKSDVSVTKTVVQSTTIATSLYIGVGMITALAVPNVSQNMLEAMVSGAFGNGMQIAGSFFAFFIIGLDIPLFCVLTRYNLTHSGLCSVSTANLAVVWIPWGISWLFYQGDAIGCLLEWGGVLLTGAAAFILPLYLALYVAQYYSELILPKPASGIDKPYWWFGSIPLHGSKSTNVYACCKIFTHSRKTAYLLALGSLWMLASLLVCVALGGQIYMAEKPHFFVENPTPENLHHHHHKHIHYNHHYFFHKHSHTVGDTHNRDWNTTQQHYFNDTQHDYHDHSLRGNHLQSQKDHTYDVSSHLLQNNDTDDMSLQLPGKK